jgi:transposase, IS30 family
VKRRYFELIRSGLSGSEASQRVSVSLSCGSVWFIDPRRAAFNDVPISPRFLSQDDRIEIADGLARQAGQGHRGPDRQELPERIPEFARNRKPDGRYQPWYAHGQAHLRHGRPKTRAFQAGAALAAVVAAKLEQRWLPGKISRSQNP